MRQPFRKFFFLECLNVSVVKLRGGKCPLVNVSKTGVMILYDMQLTLTEIEDSTSKKTKRRTEGTVTMTMTLCLHTGTPYILNSTTLTANFHKFTILQEWKILSFSQLAHSPIVLSRRKQKKIR